jgi:hypothetical protein
MKISLELRERDSVGLVGVAGPTNTSSRSAEDRDRPWSSIALLSATATVLSNPNAFVRILLVQMRAVSHQVLVRAIYFHFDGLVRTPHCLQTS